MPPLHTLHFTLQLLLLLELHQCWIVFLIRLLWSRPKSQLKPDSLFILIFWTFSTSKAQLKSMEDCTAFLWGQIDWAYIVPFFRCQKHVYFLYIPIYTQVTQTYGRQRWYVACLQWESSCAVWFKSDFSILKSETTDYMARIHVTSQCPPNCPDNRIYSCAVMNFIYATIYFF